MDTASITNYNEMPQEDYKYAIASQIAYDNYDNKGDLNDTQQKLDGYMENYYLDPEFASENSSLIVSSDGDAILAFRGTRPTNIDDIITDAGILTNQPKTDKVPDRFIEAQRTYEEASRVYPKLEITGHSLGGTISDYISRKNDVKSVAFNAGETPFSTIDLPLNTQKKAFHYTTNTFDLVSFSNHMYSHVNPIRQVPQVVDAGSWLGSHSLDNFLPSKSQMPLSSDPETIIPTGIATASEIYEQPSFIQQQKYPMVENGNNKIIYKKFEKVREKIEINTNNKQLAFCERNPRHRKCLKQVV